MQTKTVTVFEKRKKRLQRELRKLAKKDVPWWKRTKVKQKIAANMREFPTQCEQKLADELKALAPIHGWTVNAQVVIDPYIVDFVIANKWVAIEVDGPGHRFIPRYDARRDRYLRQSGYRVLHIPNEQIINNIPLALERIVDFVCANGV